MSYSTHWDEQTISAFFNSMNVGFAHHEIILDEDGKPCDYRFVEINNSFENITGLSREQLLGKTVSESIPDIEEFWIDKYGKVALTGEFESFEHYQKRLDKIFKVIAYSNIKGEFSVLFIDSTQFKNAFELESKYKLLLENSNDIILFFDRNGNIIDANRKAILSYGYTKEELIGKNIRSIRSVETHANIQAQIEKAMREGITFETVHVKKDGKRFPVEVSSKGISLQGEMIIMTILRDISERRKTEEELYRLANFDYLTGISNRGYMIANFDKMAEMALSTSKKLAMLFFDVDKFKSINDSYGHDIGDQVLKEAAVRVSKVIRKADLFSRVGGDEFIILQSDVKSIEDVKILVDKIHAAFGNPIVFSDKSIYISTSIGISIYPDDSRDRNELMTFSDQAMYLAKQEYGNSYVFYSQMNN